MFKILCGEQSSIQMLRVKLSILIQNGIISAECRRVHRIQKSKQSDHGPFEISKGGDFNKSTGTAKLQSYPLLPLMSCARWQQAPDMSGGIARAITGYWDNLLSDPTLERGGADLHHSQTPSRIHCKWEKTPPQILLQLSSHLAKVVWNPCEKLKKEQKLSLEQGEEQSLCLDYFIS